MELLTLIALVKKLIDFLRYLRAKDANGSFTQVAAWAAGIAGLTLYVHSDFGATYSVAGVLLSKASWPTLVMAGMSLGSSGSVVSDVIAGIDSSRSTLIPSLVTGTVAPQLTGVVAHVGELLQPVVQNVTHVAGPGSAQNDAPAPRRQPAPKPSVAAQATTKRKR